MKIYYHSKNANGATFCFSWADEPAAVEKLSKLLSLGFVTKKTNHCEVLGKERGVMSIDDAIKEVGAAPVAKESLS